MSERERPRLINLADRRPDAKDEVVQESIALLEAALSAVRRGDAREVMIVTSDGDCEYAVVSSFEDVASAHLAGAYLGDFLAEWRNSE